MKIAIACDHGGFGCKQELIPYIRSLGHEVTDFGCDSAQSADYPDYGIKAAEAVARKEHDLGVVICGTGIGMSIAANKVKGVRCALCSNELMARLTRSHNDANVLSLGARIIGAELAKAIVKAFLEEPFSGDERHRRRIGKVSAYDNAR